MINNLVSYAASTARWHSAENLRRIFHIFQKLRNGLAPASLMTTMYVRFVTPLVDPDTGAETGFFRSARFIYRRGTPRWLRDAWSEQMGWYNDNLPIPAEIGLVFKRRRSIWGICWFRPEAKECIERAHYCAWLLSETGLPVRKIKAPVRREIFWKDDFQIVAKPTAETPRAFH